MNKQFKQWLKINRESKTPTSIHTMIDTHLKKNRMHHFAKLSLSIISLSLILIVGLVNFNDGFYIHALSQPYSTLVTWLRFKEEPFNEEILKNVYDNVDLSYKLENYDVNIKSMLVMNKELYFIGDVTKNGKQVKIDNSLYDKLYSKKMWTATTDSQVTKGSSFALLDNQYQFLTTVVFENQVETNTAINVAIRNLDSTNSVLVSDTVLLDDRHKMPVEYHDIKTVLGEKDRQFQIESISIEGLRTEVTVTLLKDTLKPDVMAISLNDGRKHHQYISTLQEDNQIKYIWDFGYLSSYEELSLTIENVSWSQGDTRTQANLNIDTLEFDWVPDGFEVKSIKRSGNTIAITSNENPKYGRPSMIGLGYPFENNPISGGGSTYSSQELPHNVETEINFDEAKTVDKRLPLYFRGVFRDEINFEYLIGS